MFGAKKQLGAEEVGFALDAVKQMHAGPDFPEYLFPRQALPPHEFGQLRRFERLVFFVV